MRGNPILIVFFSLVSLFPVSAAAEPEGSTTPTEGHIIRAGIIGLDTSHAPAFVKFLNDPQGRGMHLGVRIVAAFPGGSPDIPSSHDRVDQFTEQLAGMGVRIVPSIPQMLKDVDVVLIESVDGRPHLEQARQVFAAHKPVFIDKPLAGSLADAVTIAELAARNKVPWFCSSSLRFGPKLQQALHDPALGAAVGCVAWSPSPLEPHHPDLYWYGIHGCEMLYTVMGPGCETVTRVHTDGADVVTGRWTDGRLGTFRGIRAGKEDYGCVIFGQKKIAPALGFEGYEPLVEQIATFFRTGKPPVSADETIELYAFMEAADESRRQNGGPVAIADVLKKARQQASHMIDPQDRPLRDR